MEKMTDYELNEFRTEAEAYGLELYPISGIQLASIIERLDYAEKVADCAIPYMRSATMRAQVQANNNKWALPRLGAIGVAMAFGMICTQLTGAFERFSPSALNRITSDAEWLTTFGFFILSFAAPAIPLAVVLMMWIDRVARRELEKKTNA